jgi:signal transduction histidine kinase
MWVRLIPSDVRILLDLDGRVGSAQIGPSEFESVMLNLIMNASEAISGRGNILVSTVLPPPTEGPLPAVAAMSWMHICVKDKGKGMSRVAARRAFQPGFSSKPMGLGIGLSVAKYVLEAVGGTIAISSEPGAGTEVRICLIQASGERLPQSEFGRSAACRPGPAAV